MREFWKFTPGGNPTVFMRAEDVPVSRRAEVAGQIMNPLHLGGEQVGFVRFAPVPADGVGQTPRLEKWEY